METSDWALEAIGFYNENFGAEVSAIIEYIDYRDHFRYEADEIEIALKQLVKDGKVILLEGKYFLAD